MLDEQFAREFAERYLEAWNSHDAERIEPLVQDFMRATWVAFPDLRFTSGPMWLDPHEDSMTWAWRIEGTHSGPLDPPGFAPTGRPIDLDGLDVWDFAERRIDRLRAYYDTAQVARQLGVMPAPGSLGERVGVMLQRAHARFARR